MDQAPSFVGLIPPAWILVLLIGAFWTGVVTVIVPPRADRFPRILVGGIVGASLGQVAGGAMMRSFLASVTLGDVHLAAVTAGAVLALGVVRRFSA